jgi:DNA-binding CsgD family transcriptional regulator
LSDEPSAGDLRRALRIVRELHEDGHDGEVAAAGLAALGRLVGCEVTSVTRADHVSRRIVGAVVDQPEHNLFDNPEFGMLAHQHPAFAAYRAGELTLGSSVALTDLVDPPALRRLPLFNDFYRPRGTVDQLLCVVRVDERQGSVLALNRSRFGFSARDRVVVDLLAPHVAQALAWRERLAAARTTTSEDGLAAWSMLTPRQQQVAGQVARGATDREIARSLVISPRTVHKHLEQIYRKLELTNRTGLVALLSGTSPPVAVRGCA